MTYRSCSIARLVQLLLLATAGTLSPHAASTTLEEASKAELQAATEEYEAGLAAMGAEKYAEALERFKNSNDKVSSPNSRMMIGRALIKLGRLADAFRELSQAVEDAEALAKSQKRYRKTVETATAELADIRERLAYVTVKQLKEVTIKGRSLTPEEMLEPQPVDPGAVSIAVTYADGNKSAETLTLAPGERKEVSLTPPASNAPAPPKAETPCVTIATPSKQTESNGLSRMTAGLAVGGVGVLGVAAFVGVGIVASSRYGDPKSTCGAGTCPENEMDKASSKSLYQGIGYAGLGIGILGLGVGTWLILSHEDDTDSSSSETALRVGPSSLQLSHRF